VTNGGGLGLGIWARHRGHPQSSLNCVMKRAQSCWGRRDGVGLIVLETDEGSGTIKL